ncbi:MAG: ECF-type sigma factor [Aureliella sp.]
MSKSGSDSEVTLLLKRIEGGECAATDELFPLVYNELRRLAEVAMRSERAGHTLDATALVHEVWLRLAADQSDRLWQSRRHFFGAASRAMQRILVDAARRKLRQKRGGDAQRQELGADIVCHRMKSDEVIAVHEALEALRTLDPEAAELVSLHYFGGFSIDEISTLLNVSRATAYRTWTFAKAWLKSRIDNK